MTQDDAKQEAFRRWGDIGVVRDRTENHHHLLGRYMVGTMAHPMRGNVIVHGEGASWEEAFEDASKRAKFLQPYLDDVTKLFGEFHER